MGMTGEKPVCARRPLGISMAKKKPNAKSGSKRPASGSRNSSGNVIPELTADGKVQEKYGSLSFRATIAGIFVSVILSIGGVIYSNRPSPQLEKLNETINDISSIAVSDDMVRKTNSILFETSVDLLFILEPSNANMFPDLQFEAFRSIASDQLIPLGLVTLVNDADIEKHRALFLKTPGVDRATAKRFFAGGLVLTDKGKAVREYAMGNRPKFDGELLLNEYGSFVRIPRKNVAAETNLPKSEPRLPRTLPFTVDTSKFGGGLVGTVTGKLVLSNRSGVVKMSRSYYSYLVPKDEPNIKINAIEAGLFVSSESGYFGAFSSSKKQPIDSIFLKPGESVDANIGDLLIPIDDGTKLDGSKFCITIYMALSMTDGSPVYGIGKDGKRFRFDKVPAIKMMCTGDDFFN